MPRRKTTVPQSRATVDGYEVGYGQPPTHSQFRPGQSGNPAGRRKGVRNLKTDVKRTPEDAGQGEGGRPHADEVNAGRCSSWCCARRPSEATRARSIGSLSWRCASTTTQARSVPAQALAADDQAILAAYAAEVAAAATTPATDSVRCRSRSETRAGSDKKAPK